MQNNSIPYPPLIARVISVWWRHMRVYSKNLISNGFPPFLEPLIFLVGMGIGLGDNINPDMFGGVPYMAFLAPGLLITTAMFTSAYECSYGTFIRLEFDHVYDGMLAAPISVNNLLAGEILWAGTKGFFFTSAVLIVVTLFGVVRTPLALITPFIGLATGLLFGAMSLLVTSFVTNINHFSFYFTGFLSPMFFFSGVIFPVASLPGGLKQAAEVFPLTHAVRLSQAICLGRYGITMLFDVLYLVAVTAGVSFLAIRRLRKRLID